MIARKDGVTLRFLKHYYVVAHVLEMRGWRVNFWEPKGFKEWLRARLADLIGGVLLEIGGKEK